MHLRFRSASLLFSVKLIQKSVKNEPRALERGSSKSTLDLFRQTARDMTPMTERKKNPRLYTVLCSTVIERTSVVIGGGGKTNFIILAASVDFTILLV